MTKTEELLSQQITKLQTDLSNLQSELSALCAGCAAKHRLNLTAEIARLDADIINLRNQLSSLAKSITDNYNSITGLKTELTEVKGKLNILMLKIDDLTFDKTKSKDNKYYFVTQILIVVFAFIITGVLGFISTNIWKSLTGNEQYVQQVKNSKK